MTAKQAYIKFCTKGRPELSGCFNRDWELISVSGNMDTPIHLWWQGLSKQQQASIARVPTWLSSRRKFERIAKVQYLLYMYRTLWDSEPLQQVYQFSRRQWFTKGHYRNRYLPELNNYSVVKWWASLAYHEQLRITRVPSWLTDAVTR